MSRPAFPANEAQIPAPSAGLASGAMINDATLGPCVVEGLLPGQAAGDPITVRHGKGPTVWMPAADATTFAKAVIVEHDNATGTVVADGAGDFDAGRVLVAKAAGETEVLVTLDA